MNETQKNALKAAGHATAENIANKATEEAKTATGWKKWAWLALAAAAAAAAYFTLPSCTAAQREQVEGAHALYHLISGKDCIFVTPIEK